MKLKTLLAMAATLALALALAACGGADDDDGGSGGADGELSSAPGFNGETINLGVLSPLSGPVAVIGEPLTAGNQTYFEKVNAEGGIAGRYRVRLVTEDTRYENDTTVQQYNQIKDDVTMFTQLLGTPPTLATLPSLNRDGIVAAPASLDAFWVREPNLLPVGGPYQIQAINALDYYVNESDGAGKNICFMGQDDAYGEAGLAGVQAAAEANDFEVVSEQEFRTGDQDVTGQIQALAQADCDAVFLTSVPSDTGTILGAAAQLEFAPRWILQSPAWIGALADSPLRPYLEQTTWVVAEGPEWGDRSVEGMAEMLDDIEAHSPDQQPDYYFSFGYVQAKAVTAVLEKAVELGDLSREGITKAMEELDTVEFGGLFGDYEYGGAENRQFPTASSIFEIDPDNPISLGSLTQDYESEAAKQFEISERVSG